MMAFCLFFVLMLSNPAVAGSWSQTSLGGFSRVDIYTPDSVSSVGNGRALLIVLHGCAQAISAFRGANLEQAAEAHGMVVAVPDAQNKAGFSCWSYWQGAISRNAGDYRNLINLANALTGDQQRNIDENQVYIAGLSSGAAFANTTACLAPDIFAGVGVSAGPSIGTSASGAIGSCEFADVAARCRQYAGGLVDQLNTQLSSMAQARNDSTVNTCYNRQNAEGMARVYGVDEVPGTLTITDTDGRSAEQTLWENQRVSLLWFQNVGHAWSGGAGASGSFISGNSINYADYLGAFFSANNLRINRNQAPVVDTLNVSAVDNRIAVSGDASDIDSILSHVQIAIHRLADDAQVASASVNTAADGGFQFTSAALPDELYEVSVMAVDDEGLVSLPRTDSVRIGLPPPPEAPVLSDLTVVVEGQCVAIGGRVVDANNDVQGVQVAIDNAPAAAADVDGTSFSYSQCDIAGGDHQATIIATDATDLNASLAAAFTVDAGITAPLQTHIDEGRLDFTAYANCFLEYGSTDPFRLDEISANGDQCRWSDGATCTGPVQACRGDNGSGGGGGGSEPPSGDACSAETTFNYYHKLAGRAFSEGPVFSPDYFAQGSNDPLPGSTWGSNTVHQFNGSGSWFAGDCP
jgi:poly(hydroxyalkanoate) depolymerase family esterase